MPQSGLEWCLLIIFFLGGGLRGGLKGAKFKIRLEIYVIYIDFVLKSLCAYSYYIGFISVRTNFRKLPNFSDFYTGTGIKTVSNRYIADIMRDRK